MGLWAGLKKLLRMSGDAASVSAGMQVLTPGMAALMPPRELARRWTDFLPLLNAGKRPVLLALGGDDAVRKRLWLSTPECKYLRDDPSGLAFVMYPDSLWVDVPAAFVAPPAAEAGAPAPAAGAPGLWEELVRFLPELSGGAGAQGVAVFIDAARDAESAARDALWLAGKLDRLFAGRGKAAAARWPSLWVVSCGLEKFPGGARLAEKIGICGEALGGLSRSRRDTIRGAAFDSCLTELEEGLGDFIRSCDATGMDDALSPEVHLLRHSLSGMMRNARVFCEAVAHGGKARAARLGGVFLCGEAARGLAFGAALPRSVISEGSRRPLRAKPGWALHAASVLFLLAGAAGLGATYFRAQAFIDAIPFRLLGPPDGVPPVARYARAHAELGRLEHSRPLERALYTAPNRALGAAEKLLAGNLAAALPAPDDPALADAWADGLAEWAERREGVAPVAFATLSGKRVARVRGAHGGAGRDAAAKLLAAWRTRLDEAARGKIDFVQREYDSRLFADWRRSGGEILAATLASAEADDFAGAAGAKDFLASDVGSAFVRKAGEELAFSGEADSEWARAAVAVAGVMKEASPDNDSDSPSAKRLREYREVLAALHPRSLDETALAELAADSYSPPGGNPSPQSLVDADGAWKALEAALRAREPLFAAAEGKEVAELLKSRQSLLQRAALARAAARVRSEWDELVRAPLERLDADAALLFVMDEKPQRAFAKSFAKRFLVVRDGGWRPARALGADFPFTEEAVAWLNRAESVAAGLDGEYPVRLALLPVTVDRGARIFPRGIRFTQNTADGPVSVTGYNNRAETAFTWSARACSDVELAIFFDAFTLRKTYAGRLGFLHFLQSLKKGALVLPAAAFPEWRRALERGGVHSLHVNFELSDPKAAASLDAELPPPPLSAVR